MREKPQDLRELAPDAVHASPIAGLILIVTAPWGERTWLRVYCIAVAMAALLSFTGAFGTANLSEWTRFTYWLVVMMGGTVAVQLVSLVMDRFLRLDPVPDAIVQFLAFTPVITVVVWLLTTVFEGSAFDVARLRFFIGPVACITAFMCVIQYLSHREPKQSHVYRTPETKTEPALAFRERLPFKYRHAELYALSAEDHYLRVHTSAGDTLILMRLYDAIRELDGIEGSQTHRSWWVAKDAVADVTRGDGRVSLTLKNAVAAPVSRSYQKTLKQDGWV